MNLRSLRAIRITSVLVVLALFGLQNAWCEASSFTLSALYEKASKQSEAIKRDEASVQIAEASYRKALSALYPVLDLNVTEEFRNSSSFQIDRASQSSRQDQFEIGFRISQPLFRGFRDLFLKDAAKKSIEAESLILERNKEILYGKVAELYFQALLYEADIETLLETEKTLSSRVKELSEWLALGKSKESEKLVAESDLASSRVSVAESKRLLAATKEALAFISGVPSREISLNKKITLPALEPLESYLSTGRSRADIEATRVKVDAQKLIVKATERERWPEVNLEGNSYTFQSPEERRDWDVAIRLSFPIFEGGLTQARVAEEDAKLRREILNLEEIERKREEEIRISYVSIEGSINERQALGMLLGAAKKNLSAQQEDYKLGIVTNLDVLAAIRQLQDAKRRVSENEIRSMLEFERLTVASGRRA